MVTVEANAKINLTLDILGTRPDGYHDVEMVMQSVGLSDIIYLERREKGISLQMDVPELPTDKTNLAWKAAHLFLDVYKIQSGVSIKIKKKIPIAAGLAGGSADAAGTLIGMNSLFETRLSKKELCKLGEKIGSDVPFCIEGGTMLATGRGEVLRRLPDLPQLFVVLAKPPVSVSTAWAYKNYDKMGSTRHPDTNAILSAITTGHVEGIEKALANVLEEATMKAYPIVEEYKRILAENGATEALMSGSGPTVFAIAREKKDMEHAAAMLSHAYPDAAIFVVPTVKQNTIS